MTRVLAFCDYFEAPMGGGAEIVSAEVYGRLVASEAFDITVVSGVPGRRRVSPMTFPPATKLPRVIRSRGLDLSRLLNAQLSIAPGLARSAFSEVRKQRPDVIHASSIHFFGSLLGAAIARLKKIPLVTTCHLSGLDALPRRTRVLASIYERTCGRFILHRSQRIIAVSETVRNHVIDLGVEPEKVEVIENGVDVERFAPGLRDESTVQVAFVGRLISNKGPMEVLDAIGQLDSPKLRMVFAGAGPLADEIAEHDLNDPRVQYLGHREDVHELLAKSHIFLRPSTSEGRSLAILEAMAAGCAVIASDIAANSELVDHGRTGILVPAGDVSALRDALAELVEDRSLRERLGNAARAQVLGATWEATSEATGRVLAGACGAHGS